MVGASASPRSSAAPKGAAVEADVDVPVAGDFHRGDARDRTDAVDQFLGDLLRRLAQLLGELEGGRHRHFAEVALPRLLDGDRQIDAVANLNVRAERAGDLLFNGMEHGNYEYSKGCSASVRYIRKCCATESV